MDGVNEVGEVKVSRVQTEGENEDQTPTNHKVARSSLSLSFDTSQRRLNSTLSSVVSFLSHLRFSLVDESQ